MAEESTRTKIIREAKVDDDLTGLKNVAKKVFETFSSLGDKAGVTQKKEYDDIDYGAKTAIGQAAAEKASKEYQSNQKNWPLDARKDLEAALKARDEADAEVKRETRGQVKFKKGGYTIDGCAIRGKTRAKLK